MRPTDPAIHLNYQYRGSTIGNALNAVGAGLLNICTLGIAYPWAKTMRMRYICEHTYINGQKMRFTGSGGALWGQYIKWWLLTLITFGLYGFRISGRLRKWQIEHQTAALPLELPAPRDH